MNILNFKIYGFGNIISKEYSFTNGINEIKYETEEEKTTVCDFIVSMFYGLGGRSDGGFRKKYFPGTMVRFGGEMNVEASGRTYYISQFWGLAKQKDDVKFIETPGSRMIPLGNKTIGEILFNLQEPAFRSAIFTDFNALKDNYFGYITPELSLTFDEEYSFFAAEKKINARLNEIKSNDNKNGELDILVIQKMSKTNELTRMSEQDARITGKKKQLEALAHNKKELSVKSKKQLRKVLLANSCEALLEKDKIQANAQAVKLDCEQAELLENKKYYIEKRDLKSELKIPFFIFAIIEALFVITGALSFVSSKIIPLAGVFLLASIVAGAVLIIKKADFDGRYTIVVGGVKTNIYDEIKRTKRKMNDDIDALTISLNGKTYEEQEELWRKSEELLRDASEDERRNAILTKNADDERMLEELNAQIKPLDEQISAVENDIENMSVNLSTAYTDATAMLVGIDDKIKELGYEYKILTLAKESFKTAKESLTNGLMPKIFDDAKFIFKEAYNDRIDFAMDEQGRISSNARNKEMQKRALVSLKTAINKNLFVQESNFMLLSNECIDTQILPIDIKQVIVFNGDKA